MSSCWSLLALAAPVSRRVAVEGLGGSKVGVHGSSWLEKLVRGHAARQNVGLCESVVEEFAARVEALRKMGVRVRVAFDGVVLPMRRETMRVADERMRREAELAEQLTGRDFRNKAGGHLANSVFVTFHVLRSVCGMLKSRGIEFVVAPSEACAQLAYWASVGEIDYAMTEDPEVLMYHFERPLLIRWACEQGDVTVLSQREVLEFVGVKEEDVRRCCCLAGTSLSPRVSDFGVVALINKAKTGEDVMEGVTEDHKHQIEAVQTAYREMLVFDRNGGLVSLSGKESSCEIGPRFSSADLARQFYHGEVNPSEVDAVCCFGPSPKTVSSEEHSSPKKETTDIHTKQRSSKRSPERTKSRPKNQMDITSFFHVQTDK